MSIRRLLPLLPFLSLLPLPLWAAQNHFGELTKLPVSERCLAVYEVMAHVSQSDAQLLADPARNSMWSMKFIVSEMGVLGELANEAGCTDLGTHLANGAALMRQALAGEENAERLGVWKTQLAGLREREVGTWKQASSEVSDDFAPAAAAAAEEVKASAREALSGTRSPLP